MVVAAESHRQTVRMLPLADARRIAGFFSRIRTLVETRKAKLRAAFHPKRELGFAGEVRIGLGLDGWGGKKVAGKIELQTRREMDPFARSGSWWNEPIDFLEIRNYGTRKNIRITQIGRDGHEAELYSGIIGKEHHDRYRRVKLDAQERFRDGRAESYADSINGTYSIRIYADRGIRK